MPRTFVTADSHLGHKGILSDRFANRRPFLSIEEHDEAIIAAWNAVVRPDDIVWHLGDFAYKCSLDHAAGIFARLRGKKYLCRGNHDIGLGERLKWDGPVVDVKRIFIQDPGMPERVAAWISHYSHRTWPHAWHGDLHFYGHSHGTLPGTKTSLDVGVDCWNLAPVGLADIQKRLASTPNEV